MTLNQDYEPNPAAGAPEPRSAWRRFGLPVALLAGGLALGSAVMPIGLANADDAETATTDDVDTGMREHGPGGRHRGQQVQALTELLGVEPSDLRAAFENGQTLAEFAEANGVSTGELVAVLVADAEERIDAAVEAGRLTEDEAADRRAELTERITERVTNLPEKRTP